MIFRYAWKNICRSFGRNILIGLIVFVIATAACVALSVQQAAETARKTSMEGLSVSGHIYVDRQYIMENMEPGSTSMREVLETMSGLTLDEMEYYASAPSVQSFTYYSSISLNGNEDLEPLSSRIEDEETEEAEETKEEPKKETVKLGPNGEKPPTAPEQPQEPEEMLQAMIYQGDFNLLGYYDENAMSEFINGTCYLTEGEMFSENTDEFVCLVTQELATLNDLSVGDQITLCNPNDTEESYTFTISGIYKNTEMDANTAVAANDPANRILTSYSVVQQILSTSAEGEKPVQQSLTGTYMFSSVSDYDSFETEVRELGLSEKYTLTSNDIAQFEQSMLLLDNLKSFAQTFLLITLLIGALVLVVISIFNIRDRKYEIGALAAMGMKKGKLVGLFVTEIIIVTLSAILIGCAAGSAVSVPLTNSLLEAQVEQQKEEDAKAAANFGREQTAQEKPKYGDVEGEVEYVSAIGFSTNYIVILKMIGIGLALSMFSGITAVLFILRYDPKQILANRD